MVEYFLVMSLISCTSLYREGIIGTFLYVSLILVAILYHLFLVAMNMYLVARSICNMECLRFLRGTKFHRGMLKICLIPVCRYLSAVGLGQGEKCPGKSALVLLYLMVHMKDLRSECFIWPICIFICFSLQAICTNLSYYRLSSTSYFAMRIFQTHRIL